MDGPLRDDVRNPVFVEEHIPKDAVHILQHLWCDDVTRLPVGIDLPFVIQHDKVVRKPGGQVDVMDRVMNQFT